MAYRNVYYDYSNEVIHLFTWDSQGRRQTVQCSFEPYLYVESEKTQDAVSIFNTSLKKVSFRSQKERDNFVKSTSIKRLFHNLNVEQQFLHDTFKDEVDKPDFGKQPLKIFYIDIETYATTHFSKPTDADDPINLITIYDSISKKFYTFGCGNYATTDDNVKYTKCLDERDLLSTFLRFWRKDFPDIVTGWNIDGYDIPYIINRLNKLFNNDRKANELSPVDRLYFKEKAAVNKLGRQIDRWYIKGVSVLDYMDLYISFSLGDRESYSLNYISEYELEEGKIAFGSTSLSKLADEDWMKFVDYNIQDVKLLIKLEEKLKYIKLIRNLSYKGFIPFDKASGKVLLITGAVAHQAYKQGLVIPTFNIENEKKNFAGGYVYEPTPGLYQDIVTYDANSLYPNTIITLNISTETKVGKIIKFHDNGIDVRLTNQKVVSFTNENFKKFIKDQNLSVTKANVLYTQKFKGVVPNLIDKLYTERVSAKNKMLEAEKKLKKTKDENQKMILREEATDNYILQNVYKVVLNSIYGVFSQRYSPLFDIDHAESVTLTGQAMVKSGAKIVHEYVTSKGVEGDVHDVCVYSDTDSVYFSFNKLFSKLGISLQKNGEITEEANKTIKEIGNYLNEKINVWAKKELNTIDPRYVFKREKICDVALLQAKKFYILHILDKEGVHTNEFEYKGIEVAKSIISKEVKQLIKNVVESAIMSKDRVQAGHLFQESYEKFCEMPPEIIATRKKVNNLNKWEDLVTTTVTEINMFDMQNIKVENEKLAKGTPQHAGATIYYNKLLEELNLTDKYQQITTGSKIKFVYCKKNKFGYKVLAFGDEYPKEFLAYIEPDYKTMFEKNVAPVISRIFTIIGWPVPSVGCQEHTDLIALFS